MGRGKKRNAGHGPTEDRSRNKGQELVQLVLSGQVQLPEFATLRMFHPSDRRVSVEVQVMCDALRHPDGERSPVDATDMQKIADANDCVFMTALMMDARAVAAEIQIEPVPYWVHAPSRWIDRAIEQAPRGRAANRIVSNPGPTWIASRFWTGATWNKGRMLHGGYSTWASGFSPTGALDKTDLRLIHSMEINGQISRSAVLLARQACRVINGASTDHAKAFDARLESVYRDPFLAACVSHEGALLMTRQPGTVYEMERVAGLDLSHRELAEEQLLAAEADADGISGQLARFRFANRARN